MTMVGSRSRSLMVMRAKVHRNSTSSKNDWGLPDAPSYGFSEEIPCRVWSESRSQIVDGDRKVAFEQIKAMFPRDADIREGDRITKVVDRTGKTIYSGPLEVSVLVRRPIHLRANLERDES